MILHDRMLYAGFRTSRRCARLSWFERDVFHGLINVADDFGCFENDAGLLRSVLYAPLTHKVSERDVEGALVRMHELGLVKLYTVGGRGYGKVGNFRQHGLRSKTALYPDNVVGVDESGADQLPLAGVDPPDREHPPPVPVQKKEGRKGGARKAPPPQDEWLQTLRSEHPEIDLTRELEKARAHQARQGKDLDRPFFEKWLRNAGPYVDTSAPKRTVRADWRERIEAAYPPEHCPGVRQALEQNDPNLLPALVRDEVLR